MPIRTTRLLAVTAALVFVMSGCDGDNPLTTASPADDSPVDNTASSQPEEHADDLSSDGDDVVSSSEVFVPQIVAALDLERSVAVPSGDHAGVGFVCNSGGGDQDIAYAGVSGVNDGLYTVESDGVPGTITLSTGPPTSGLAAGAFQTSLKDESYTFEFIELGVEVTIPGCS